MDRRAFVAGTVGLLAAPLAAEAQKVYRIAYIANGNQTTSAASVEGFRQGLRELGWVEGQNVAIEYRWADGNLDRLAALAADLIKAPVDVIVVAGGPAVRAARQASHTIPIVSAIMGDPVSAGFAASLARPGGNVTGGAVQFEDLATKQLQILKEMVPNVARVAILDDPMIQNASVQKAAETAAGALGLKARVFSVRDESDLERAFRAAKTDRADAMYVLPSPRLSRFRSRLAELAVKHRLPGIYEDKVYVEVGGLMSYGPNFPDLFRRAASYVDRILKGAKPGTLPIEQPTKFEFAINLKAAKALGLTIPAAVLARADEVIQ